jgi:hypothetical protein
VKLKPTATATASVVALALADMDPRLVISSEPSPPSIPEPCIGSGGGFAHFSSA